MSVGGINLFAVSASAVASFAAGSIWYALLFRDAYLEGLGKSPEALAKGPSMATASIVQFLGCIAIAATLGWLMHRMDLRGVHAGVLLAAVAWFGFVVSVVGPMYAYQAYSLKFFAIVTGNLLFVFTISGAIVGAWR